MDKKIVNRSDSQRVALDSSNFNLIWYCKGAKGNIKQYNESNDPHIKLPNGDCIYVKKINRITILSLRVHLNGYKLVREHFEKTERIDFTPYQSTVKGQDNFIPLSLISSSHIKWRGIWRKVLPSNIFYLLEQKRVETEAQLKESLETTELSFQHCSLYSAEIGLDILSPLGAELITLPQVKSALSKHSSVFGRGIFTKGSTQDENEITNNITFLTEGYENSKPVIRGETVSGPSYILYVKEKVVTNSDSHKHFQLLNRFELRLHDSRIIRKVLTNKRNTFTQRSELISIFEELFNFWFNFIYRVLGIEYDSDNEEVIQRVMKEYISEYHPHRCDLVVRDLFEAGKLCLGNNDYVKSRFLSSMIENKLIYKMGRKKNGLTFYALHSDFRQRVINELKGNQHGI